MLSQKSTSILKIARKESNSNNKCSRCGYTVHRDLNSAENVLALGLDGLGVHPRIASAFRQGSSHKERDMSTKERDMSTPSIIKQLTDLLQQAITIAYPSLQNVTLDIAKSKDTAFGDYQCNSAMKLSKQLSLSPRTIATTVINAMPPHAALMCEKIDIAGPGFINLKLNPSFLASQLTIALQSRTILPLTDNPKRVIIDFSSPNIAKEMHVGHLRSTIIGECLSRVFEALGHDVLRLNHVGDWGTAFGMLIAHIKSLPDFSADKVATFSLTNLMGLYRQSKIHFDNDDVFRKQSQQEVVRLQGGEKESLSIWRIICDISENAYQEIYALLDVTIQKRGESFYNPMLPGIVKEMEDKGLVTLSDGAKCLFLEGFINREGNPLPLMLQKSDGGFNYDTTDMAAIAQRVREEHAERIIYVTDSGQATHFQMIFTAAERAGILDPKKIRVDHVPFGLVLGPDGKKFRTRSGETERLIDLLLAAINYADTLLRSKNPDWTEEEYRIVAKILGIGAVKYADLSSHRISDYVFSYDRMLRFEGNTAAFIMYSYVRTASIQRKVGKQSSEDLFSIDLLHPSEISLAKILCQFSETLDEVADTLLPNRLTDYLYTLSESFNAFFRDCRVEGDARQNQRLALVILTGWTLKNGLHLLGIQVPEKM
jgi:arginyl-tRNA synthetase